MDGWPCVEDEFRATAFLRISLKKSGILRKQEQLCDFGRFQPPIGQERSKRRLISRAKRRIIDPRSKIVKVKQKEQSGEDK